MNKLLLDTNAFIWFVEGDEKAMSKPARAGIEDSDSVIYVSTVTLWEIAIKASLNKLVLKKARENKLNILLL